MNENELSRIIYEAAIEVHRTFGGPSLLESVYEEALFGLGVTASRGKSRTTVGFTDYL